MLRTWRLHIGAESVRHWRAGFACEGTKAALNHPVLQVAGASAEAGGPGARLGSSQQRTPRSPLDICPTGADQRTSSHLHRRRQGPCQDKRTPPRSCHQVCWPATSSFSLPTWRLNVGAGQGRNRGAGGLKGHGAAAGRQLKLGWLIVGVETRRRQHVAVRCRGKQRGERKQDLREGGAAVRARRALREAAVCSRKVLGLQSEPPLGCTYKLSRESAHPQQAQAKLDSRQWQ